MVVDSGSTDGTHELVAERVAGFPVALHLHRIETVEFDHGDTRNLLALHSSGDLLVFLSQDAIPSRPDWLACLSKNFDDPAIGAAYCRNVPRADSRLLTKVFCRSDPGYASERSVARVPEPDVYAALDSDERRLLYNFNDVASAVRRELWERHPFPRTMMGEDVLMGRAVLEAGYGIAYDVDATVDHSHDYGPKKMHWRGEVDARFNAEYLDRLCVRAESDMDVLIERMLRDDREELERLGYEGDELERLCDEATALRTPLRPRAVGRQPSHSPLPTHGDAGCEHVAALVHRSAVRVRTSTRPALGQGAARARA